MGLVRLSFDTKAALVLALSCLTILNPNHHASAELPRFLVVPVLREVFVKEICSPGAYWRPCFGLSARSCKQAARSTFRLCFDANKKLSSWWLPETAMEKEVPEVATCAAQTLYANYLNDLSPTPECFYELGDFARAVPDEAFSDAFPLVLLKEPEYRLLLQLFPARAQEVLTLFRDSRRGASTDALKRRISFLDAGWSNFGQRIGNTPRTREFLTKVGELAFLIRQNPELLAVLSKEYFDPETQFYDRPSRDKSKQQFARLDLLSQEIFRKMLLLLRSAQTHARYRNSLRTRQRVLDQLRQMGMAVSERELEEAADNLTEGDHQAIRSHMRTIEQLVEHSRDMHGDRLFDIALLVWKALPAELL